ncbi:MAG: SCO family protein [Pyrinomonadaceae bacterium]
MKGNKFVLRFLGVLITVVLLVWPVYAQMQQATPDIVVQSSSELIDRIGIDQKLNEQVPLDIHFRDETGREVQLGEYFKTGKPVILSLVYFDCPMLCTMILNGLTNSIEDIPYTAGQDYTIVTVSFDPREKPELAARKKAVYLKRYGRPPAANGWYFLTGDEDQIRRLTSAVGFRYAFDERTGQYAHASGIMVLTPGGKLSKYLYGVDYSARDLRLSLVEASENKIGTPVDRLLLLCYHYDPSTGKYSSIAMTAVRIGGILTLIALVTFILLMIRRDRQRNRRLKEQAPQVVRQSR